MPTQIHNVDGGDSIVSKRLLARAGIAGAVVLVAAAGCGSGESSTSTHAPSAQRAPDLSASSSTTSPKAPTFDPCLVGSWTVDSATLPFQASSTQTVPVSGAQGTRTVIAPDGTEADDFDPSGPLTGSFSGQPLTVTLRGSASTLLGSSNGTVTVQPGATSGITATDTFGGQQQSASLPPATAGTQYSYTCGPTSFSITRQGERVVYSKS